MNVPMYLRERASATVLAGAAPIRSSERRVDEAISGERERSGKERTGGRRSLPTRTCPDSGKYCFPSRRAAKHAQRTAAQRRIRVIEALGGPEATSRFEIRAYKCADCHHWHLRTGPRREPRW